MSHPPETSRELTEQIRKILGIEIYNLETNEPWREIAALIDAWVQRERDTAHAEAINAAAQICEDWSTSCWDSFRDQAMAVAQRAVNIRALTLASANSDPPDGQGQEEPEMDQARVAYLKGFSDGQLKVFETIHELSYKCKTAAEMVFKIGELHGEFASAEAQKESELVKGESA